jgi:hypothetical protein
MKDLRAH